MMLVIGVRSSWLTVDDEVALDPLQLAQPLHGRALVLEGEQQRALGVLALGDVLGGGEVAGQLAALAGDGGQRHPHRALLAVLAAEAPQLVARRPPRPRPGRCRRSSAAPAAARPGAAARSAGWNMSGQLADDLLGEVAEHRLGARVEQRDAAVRGRWR